ncbi:hypothetical protein [Neolewinella litorea]|uniref:Magnesium citrate secondary transporter n=1 Tax=Neolewinella litorea TaxID=2562452 RepID=A0A4S4NQ49_9BACT|nr:hypothetical protein [Neolewinella litorea]THH40511.1 hypothetical protein E4021_07180 [Neolewinella litorea]
MKVLLNPWFWLVVVAFLVHLVLNRVGGLQLGLVDHYLDPFCAAPILLGLWSLERNLVFRRPRISAVETAVATLLLALIFEEVFPRYGEGFRHDLLDYLFYGLGGVYFYFLVNGGDRSEPTG